MTIIILILEFIAGIAGVFEPIAKFIQWLKRRSKTYEVNIIRFNEYLYKHFGSYFFAVCTTVGRYHDVQSRNSRIGLNRVFDTLSDSKGPRVVILWAEGGMGKTTLASHIVRTTYLQEKWFSVLVGGSAKQQSYIDGQLKTYNDAVLTYSSLLNLMGQQFGVANINKIASIEEKISFLQRKLRNQKALLLVDNLETISNTEEIVDGLTRMVANTNGSKVLITTRDGRLNGRDILPIHLDPFTVEEGLEFAKWYVHIRGFDKYSAMPFSSNTLREVVEVTGGSPLAIEQVISQAAIIGGKALENIRNVSGDWQKFYDFLFTNIYEELRLNIGAKRVLWYVASLHRPSTLEDLINLAKEEGFYDDLETIIKTLVGLDLLKIGTLFSAPDQSYQYLKEKASMTLYSVSPMLTNFILRNKDGFTVNK